AGAAYPPDTSTAAGAKVPYDADVTLLFSEIDPRQNAAVDLAATDGASELTLFNDAGCLPAGKQHCYPPAVNYAPTYFLINGQAYDPSAPQKSGFALSGNTVLPGGGQVLLRLVNAGSRTHVPSVVGLPVGAQDPLRIVAEDGNLAPGVPKAQSHILLPASKTFDVAVTPPTIPATTPATYATKAYPIFDRALSLTSGNLDKQSVVSNSGMLGFIAMQASGSTVGGTGAAVPVAMTARAVNDNFATPVDTAFNGNVLANDVNVVTAALGKSPIHGTVAFDLNGSFIYSPASGYTGTDTFTYTGNPNGTAPPTATVIITVGVNDLTKQPVAIADTATSAAAFNSKVASVFTVGAPGVLANDSDPNHLALTAVLDSVGTCKSVALQPSGGFTAVPGASGAACTFQYHAKNGLGAVSQPVDATVNFTAGSGLAITVQDEQDRAVQVGDYSWIIEEDTTYFHDPANPTATNTLATNFHKSYMPVVATGCTGPNSCGDSQTVGGTAVTDASLNLARARSKPGDVVLDPTKRYFISILPGDADQGDASYNADGTVTVNAFGHTMGGVSIAKAQTAATVFVPRNALPPAQISVIVFEDNNPTNGGADDNEPGLGGFTINIFDTRGSSGDPAGQMTYDLSGMPLTNSLANQKDSATHVNLCPISAPSGTIITCPANDSSGQPSTLAGMALIKNFIPGRYDVWAHPSVDRAAKGEEWIQVSTLEGTHANDTFIKAGEPSYWQEFGPPGFHAFIGFLNPAHIAAVNKQQRGTATVTGRVPSLHMDRPRPTMANLNNSCATGTNPDGSPKNPADAACRATLASSTCYVAVNSSSGTGATVAFATCDPAGNFTLTGVPAGQHEIVIWDQWLDQIIAYKALTVPNGATSVVAGDIPVFSWFTRVQQSAFIDLNQNGVNDPSEPGVSQIPMNIRFRDGSISSFLTTDSTGSVTANELFPLFNWYVLESDTTRYTGTGVNVTYDAGGKPDKAAISVTQLNGTLDPTQKDYSGLLNSTELYPLPVAQQVPNAVYTQGKTNRIDPGTTLSEGTQGYINQSTIVDWGKRPYVAGENGGIQGLVYYASTRGFDDPSLEVQFSWEPAVARVPVNLYREMANEDGSVSRILVDQTTTWSWDDASSSLHCPGEPSKGTNGLTGDPFVDVTMTQATAGTAVDPVTKCYDGQHSFNQTQPTVYDGRYHFPSAACSAAAGATFLGTNGLPVACGTVPNPAVGSVPKNSTPPVVLPPGKYVVEVVVPTGYEIVKEEDKNILIGDSWIAPAEATQFMGVGNIFIVPDQATLNDANAAGGNINTSFPPCVGALHRVPDFLSLFPDNQQLAPYAGQDRPLCDHKEVVLADQMQGTADFQVFTNTPIAGHISGIMLNDAAAEFDPYNPSFLEKASLPNAPISVRDYNGTEIARVYNDRYGTFNMLMPSTWEANVPDPSGFGSNMLTYCMNDPGPIPDPSGQIDPSTKKVRMITDPSYNPMFSNFCYNWPAMPGITTYLDTPVLPVSAYASASSYEPVDCAYPINTPAIYRVDGNGSFRNSGKTNIGPYIDTSAKSPVLTITALGDVQVSNPAYEGPNVVADAAHPTANQPTIKRHYGFGAAKGIVTIGGVKVPTSSWSDTLITLAVPTDGSVATGELAITTAATSSAPAQQSIDAVTVTIENSTAKGKPWYVAAPPPNTSLATSLPRPIQDAIDGASPGDLIIVDAGNYSELVVMDRPVRLQGVGAAAVVINAAKYPNQKIDQWRTRINNAFGLDNQGNTFGTPTVDPLPGQEITGGVILLEPSVLATEEGAGITIIAKEYRADGVTPLTVGDCKTNKLAKHAFVCGTSRIDGLSVTGGDAGGGIYVNGWAHNLEVSNNRVFGNAGPFAGGVRIGQPYLEGQVLPTNGSFAGFGFDNKVNIHNNAITNNGTVEGNAAAGATAATAGGAGGGLSICSGSDGYKVTGNWICGNYSSSDGGGIGHIGLSNNGTIKNNKILFNESYNQTGPQFGGGVVIEGEGATGTTLTLGTGNVTVDSNLIQGNFARAGSGGGIRLQSVNGADAATRNIAPWSITVTNNMIVNNLAAWAGAGISLADTLFSNVVNNTIVSNDSTGIAGNLFNTQVGSANTGSATAVPNPAGVSSDLTSAPLLNSLNNNARNSNKVSNPHLVNDIVWHNRSFFFSFAGGLPQLSPSNTWADAVAGTLPAPLGAPAAADHGCVPTAEKYWDIGVVGDTSAAVPGSANSETLTVASATQAITTQRVNGTNITRGTVTITTTSPGGLVTGETVNLSGVTPANAANAAWYTGAVVITVIDPSTFTYQTKSPNNATRAALTTAFAGLTFSGSTAAYTAPLNPTIAVGNSITSTTTGATPAALNLTKMYCNASRAAPGLQFEPGTPLQPAFNISVSATLDESGNFVDLHFGPLSVMDQSTGTVINGDYHLAGKPSIAADTGVTPAGKVPAADYDGDLRPQGTAYDSGADEWVDPSAKPVAVVAPTSLAFGNVTVNANKALTVSLSNTGTA
ncbi:MAG: hypothetical protein QOD56_2337, partial [Gammaproteobacteria bacterium]|nr:hypothetical protein [Gammaproteobacteria bacterium]